MTSHERQGVTGNHGLYRKPGRLTENKISKLCTTSPSCSGILSVTGGPSEWPVMWKTSPYHDITILCNVTMSYRECIVLCITNAHIASRSQWHLCCFQSLWLLIIQCRHSPLQTYPYTCLSGTKGSYKRPRLPSNLTRLGFPYPWLVLSNLSYSTVISIKICRRLKLSDANRFIHMVVSWIMSSIHMGTWFLWPLY